MDSTQELMRQVAELKVATWRNAKPIFDEQIARCVPAIIVDMADGQILYATPPANELFGYTNGGLDGKTITDLMPERFRALHGKHLSNYRQSPRPRQMGDAQMDLFGLSALGVEFRIEISLYPIEIINKKCAVATILPMRH